MILIGQYDSPFVRRVAVALRLYDLPYAHWPWSTFGDAERLAAYNPLRRVPTLLLDDGEVLIESAAILDYLDERAGAGRSMLPASGADRRAALKTCALATGLCDKMVSLIYERALHETTSETWIGRCMTQVGSVLDVLEADRATHAAPFWSGGRPGHADIAVACAFRFLAEAHPAIHARGHWPPLAVHSARCEGMDAFAEVVQPFVPPA
ncbi:glutathione S-transferase family protein [Gluconacetobacter tumulisoli]|uniref:Glutathione S-transferase family protein n=1 Tax=Gluconacetobacter tumulisoli TaxID=1286189 RepID=A0A7W4K474_9PROT|nr:glutathione S-transferase family protein [Gluconacetobacter tumulisoli]MBB2200086.1 glutathione S-transferase family protein [Gluconacetobacter tumulisoli]